MSDRARLLRLHEAQSGGPHKHPHIAREQHVANIGPSTAIHIRKLPPVFHEKHPGRISEGNSRVPAFGGTRADISCHPRQQRENQQDTADEDRNNVHGQDAAFGGE